MREARYSGAAILALSLAVAACGGTSHMAGASHGSIDGTGGISGGSAGQGAGHGASGSGSGGQTAANGHAGKGGEPLHGATDFVSADTASSGGALSGRAPQASAPTGSAASTTQDKSAGFGNASSTRTVERGDVYRVLGDGRIVNLNQYRGLQVIDIRDLSAPRIEGRLAVAGTPVEMYVSGDHALILLNNWNGYYGVRNDVKVETVQGGLVMSVDLSDRTSPKLLAQATVRGDITTSRLTEGGGQAALYVAANEYQDTPPYGTHTVVKSFDVSGSALTQKSELDLGGYVQDIQATTDVLLVSDSDYQNNSNRSTVSVVDISRPDGTMVRGGSVLAQGTVADKFKMDVRGHVLRVASGQTWNSTMDNHLQTFDISNLQHIVPIDDCAFSDGQSLYATIFLEDRAYLVTYLRKDPLHAFSIDAQGHCQQHAEYVVSGWNDFLRPTLGDTRLIGIGRNDQNNMNKLSVSLYDSSNVSNPNPLLARADIDLAYGYSQAQWDDRAFSVLQDAVSAKAADGTSETGLVLLPFEGWDSQGQQYLAQVQIFTFSDHTLTLRGKMDHGSAVTRSFLAQSSTAANLSEEQLSLFDTANPDQPKELGRVDVAPSYSKLLVYGDYVARVKDSNYYLKWSANQSQEPPKSQVQMLARAGDLDGGPVLASFEVKAGADLIQVGKLLVTVLIDTTYDANNMPQYHGTVEVYDLTDPLHPKPRGSLTTSRLRPSYGYGPYFGVAVSSARCFDCGIGGFYGPYGGGSTSHWVVGNAIAFANTTQQQKSLGMVHACDQYPPSQSCAISSDGTSNCPPQQYVGSIHCMTPQGGQQSCSGTILFCDSNQKTCTPVSPPPGTMTSCNDYEDIRYWQSYAFDVLDLNDPDAPKLASQVQLATDEEGSSVLADGTQLYFNFQQPYAVSGNPRASVKRYFRTIELADPEHAKLGDKINVPGDVITVDGSTIYTRDIVWSDTETRTFVARLTVDSGLAYLQASRLFNDRSVADVRLDGVGQMLVSSDPAWSYYDYFGYQQGQQPMHRLTMLDAQSLQTLGETDVDAWATFTDAKAGRALFQVSSGLLVFNVKDPAHPSAQAYFPTIGWPQDILFDGNQITFAAGPYGVYRFNADVFNLLSK